MFWNSVKFIQETLVVLLKSVKSGNQSAFFFGGGKKVYSFMLLFRSVDESCKLQKILMNYVNFFLFCFFFFFFWVSQCSQTSVMTSETGLSQEHVYLVILLQERYSNISTQWTWVMHDSFQLTDAEYLKPSRLKSPTCWSNNLEFIQGSPLSLLQSRCLLWYMSECVRWRI